MNHPYPILFFGILGIASASTLFWVIHGPTVLSVSGDVVWEEPRCAPFVSLELMFLSGLVALFAFTACWEEISDARRRDDARESQTPLESVG